MKSSTLASQGWGTRKFKPVSKAGAPGLIGSRLLAISIWKDDETKALVAKFGAATLLDKANLATTLIPAIKGHANKSNGPAEKSEF